MKTAIYARVSTRDQDCDNQLLQLREYCTARKWDVIAEYVDHGISGTKDSRPQLNLLIDAAKKRRFDAVLVWRLDRFARSLRHLVLALEEFQGLGIDFVSFQDNIDTSSATGRLMFGIIGSFAQFERDLIVERTKAGLDRARKQGKRLGPPIKVTNPERIRELRQTMSVRQIAQEMNLSVMTIYNYLKGSVA
jgi:DNA invertase Pin-like site-specific DNA recombinase